MQGIDHWDPKLQNTYHAFLAQSSPRLPEVAPGSLLMRIAILSYSDAANFGDILFPSVVARELRRRLPEVEIVFITPTGFAVPYAASIRLDEAELEEFDAVILGGGGSFIGLMTC